MEDRKRSLATDADDVAPSRKRLLKDEHGQQMRMEEGNEKQIEACELYLIVINAAPH